MTWKPEEFGHLVRWILNGEDASVAAFALPSTCEPEGYTAEQAKGNLRSVAPGAIAAERPMLSVGGPSEP